MCLIICLSATNQVPLTGILPAGKKEGKMKALEVPKSIWHIQHDVMYVCIHTYLCIHTYICGYMYVPSEEKENPVKGILLCHGDTESVNWMTQAFSIIMWTFEHLIYLFQVIPPYSPGLFLVFPWFEEPSHITESTNETIIS